jgi:hypothetical protein
MRTVVAAAVAVLLLTAPAAHAGGPRMLVGVVDPNAARSDSAAATAQLALARDAGLGDAVRVTLLWSRGRRTPKQANEDALRTLLDGAAATRTTVYLHAYPYGSSQTPLTEHDQGDFAAWLAAIARGAPLLRHVIVGNEPNLNRFWMPQFGPVGEDVAAPSYLSLLSRSYDALKAVSPAIEVLGGALAHAGVDRPGTGRDTHSPTAFVRDLGSAYRASGRAVPVMDAFAYHPYMLSSDQPPTLAHPNSTTITIADYGKLVALLGEAFDGTGQRGSSLPIVYDEFGVESQVPAAKQGLYSGTEPATTHPVLEARQAAYYADALRLAFCQPTVRAILVFSLQDETPLGGWQSGVYYADATPKASLAGVRYAARRLHRNAIASCPGLEVTPRITSGFFAYGLPRAAAGRFPVRLACDVDCTYRLRIEKLPGHGTTLATAGRLVGGSAHAVAFRRARLAPGTYRFTVTASAILNRGAPATRESAPFTVP